MKMFQKMLNHKTLIFNGFAFFLLCNVSFAAIMDKIIVIVNDEVITQGELNRKLAPIYKQLKMQYDGEALTYQMDKVQQQQLDQLINDKLVVSEAKKLGIVVTPEEIQQEVDAVKKQFQNEEDFYITLEQQGIRLEELKRNYMENIMSKKLIDNQIGAGISILPYEVKEFYRENQEKFVTPPKAKVQSLVIRVNDDRADKMAYDIVCGILYRLKKGEDFSEMAYNCSEDSYATKGGDMGYIEKGHMAKQIDDVIFSLEEGEISDIVKTPIGYHIFKAKEKIEPKQEAFYDVHSNIEEMIYRKKIQHKLEKFIKELRENAYIEYK
ncbi:MAG: peptidylprolyl isomerase [Candidatus Omnitrophica bacterium]|nr:peptidylprolyl isomerase [Candidatus Omnitrophota bacterium]